MRARGRRVPRPRRGVDSVGLRRCGRHFVPKEKTTKGSMSQPVRVTTDKKKIDVSPICGVSGIGWGGGGRTVFELG